jgi:UDP-glucose 4-epimerase
MNIFITGGCGFIGSHIAEYHLKKGDNVHVVDDLSAGQLKNIAPFQNNPAFIFDQADILTWPHLAKTVQWADRIYHMAAIIGIFRVLAEPVNVLTTNIIGCNRLLDAVVASGSQPQVILASSSSVYGQCEKLLLNEKDKLVIESAAHPLWGYAITKIADEALGLAYHRTANIPITIPRFFNVIGPRQTGRYGMVVPRFVQQACSGEPMTVFGDGTQTRSFCDVRDAVLALDMSVDKTEKNMTVLNIGCDYEITINELAELVRKRANSQLEIKYVSYKEAYGEEFLDIKQRRPDLKKLFDLTGFKHQWSLEQTIDDLIARFET